MPMEMKTKMADREGFEPSVRFHVHTRSRRAPSTTRPPVHFAFRTGEEQIVGTARYIPMNFCRSTQI
jgi:hypothetical protein